MSKASVKKALKILDRKGLETLVMELYTLRKEARDYLEFWADPDEGKELDNIKERIHKIFFLPQNKPRRKPDLTEIKSMVKNFRSLGPAPEKVADLLVYIPEKMFEWLQERRGVGMKSYRAKFDSMTDESREFIESSGLEDMFGVRHNHIVALIDTYYNSFPTETERRRYSRWFRFS